jgi:hypothetical protein
LTIERTAWTWPSAMSNTATPISSPAASDIVAPGWPLTSTWRTDMLPNGSAVRIHDSSVRATRARPWTGRLMARTLPPPSPWSTTSWASSASRAPRSPFCTAAMNRAASCSRLSAEASNRGLRSARCLRARTTSWRVLSSDLSMILAMSSYG